MIDHIPALSPIKVSEPPTLPLTPKQYAKLLEVIPIEFGGSENEQGRGPSRSADRAAKVRRMTAIIELMRYSGLAIQDAVTLERRELSWDARAKMHVVVTSRQKTGTHVSVPIPPNVAADLIAVMELCEHEKYIFWNRRDGKARSVVSIWERAFKRVFVAAGMPSGHSHQLRDTFAVELLQRGIPLEEVSKLLGHTSIRTTEKSYAPWVQARQDRLNALVAGTWAKPSDDKKQMHIVA